MLFIPKGDPTPAPFHFSSFFKILARHFWLVIFGYALLCYLSPKGTPLPLLFIFRHFSKFWLVIFGSSFLAMHFYAIYPQRGPHSRSFSFFVIFQNFGSSFLARHFWLCTSMLFIPKGDPTPAPFHFSSFFKI